MRATPQKPSKSLNLLLKFFGDGERWIKGRFSDGDPGPAPRPRLDIVRDELVMA